MQKSAQDETLSETAPQPAGHTVISGGSIAFRRAPRAGPVATGWAGVSDERLTVRIDPQQPTLPWDVEREASTTAIDAPPATPGPREPTRSNHGAIRILRFGSSWAGPPSRGMPDPAGWSIRLAGVLMEAMAGIRPVSQLDRWLAPPAMSQLTRRVRRRTVGERAALEAVHLHRNTPHRTEVVAVFGWPDRTAAMAFRLDGLGGRWLCTALELAPMRRAKRSGSGVSRRAGSRSSLA